MILFDGIKTVDKIQLVCFVNNKGERAEVPVDALVADRISKHLSRISPPFPQMGRGNDEETD